MTAKDAERKRATYGERLGQLRQRLAGVRTRTLDTHASRLRVKLEAAGIGPAVVNVWGVGYRLFD